jgi:GT2 family glycosyltransferase
MRSRDKGSRWRAAGFRASLGLVDNALSSLVNFAVGLVVARQLGIDAFGAFALVFAAHVLVLGAARALASEVLVTRYSTASQSAWRPAVASATAVAGVIGVVVGLVCVLSGSLLGGDLRHAFLALGVTLPGIVLQDTWRYAFFAAAQAGKALANDLLRALFVLVTITGLVVLDTSSVGLYVLAWGGAATVAAVGGAVQARLLPRARGSLRWLGSQRTRVPYYFAEFAVVAGATQVALYTVGVVAGLAAIGSLRAGEILLGPLSVLFVAVPLLAIPEAVRLVESAPDKLWRASILVSLALCGLALGWGLTILLLPDSLGIALMGSAWEQAERVVLPLSVAYAGYGAAAGAFVGIRSLGLAKESLKARAIAAPLILLSVALGAAVGGAVGAAIGLAAATWASVLVWWREFARARSRSISPVEQAAVALDPQPTTALGAAPEVSVVIVTWRSRDRVLRCLRSLEEHADVPYEAIVVDDGSHDGTSQSVREAFPDARVVAKARNEGLAAGRNSALPLVRGRLVLMLDADTEVQPGALSALAAVLDTRPEVGLVAPKLVYPSGALQLSCFRYPPFLQPFIRRGPYARLNPDPPVHRRHLMKDFDHESERPVVWVLGAAQMWRANLPTLIGRFDEQISSYGGEDVDWCLRVWAHGLQVRYVPEAEIVHEFQKVTRKSLYGRQSWRAFVDWYYLQAKHRSLRGDPRLMKATS